ncbi:3-oxoacyl-(acyl-carrier-protein) reductase [Mycolicibacterium rhodesiae JS60]|nr:3-oxoacyl-(acyl-carrier-protein) reductase [Mycolicibacterium rhodesiae JS60]
MKLEGKSVVITGAGSGLGRASALLFAEEGADLTLADIDEGRVAAVADEIKQRGGRVTHTQTDVRDEAQVASLVATAVKSYGRLDVMYANAGIMSPGLGAVALEDFTVEAWRTTLDVNLMGVFLCCKHSVKPMRENGGGAILTTSSMAALRAYPGSHAYSASKGGLNALVMTLSRELGAAGIRINALCPSGGMSANFLRPTDADVDGLSYDELRTWNPDRAPYPLKLDHPPTLLDNAKTALFLVSDDAAYITGLCLPSGDGGLMHTVGAQLGSGWQKKMAGAGPAPERNGSE